MESSPGPLTRTEWVDGQLRAAILTNELRPGDKLVTGALAERFQVSPTPLRESLKRLAADGLVELTPHGSARVAPLSVEDAREVYELRLALDPMALRQSLARTDTAHADEIRDAFTLLETAADVGAALAAHQAFHAALLSRCASRWLLRFTGLLADHAQRYAVASAQGRPEPPHDEHRALCAAATTGNTDVAVELLTSHLERSLAAIEARG